MTKKVINKKLGNAHMRTMFAVLLFSCILGSFLARSGVDICNCELTKGTSSCCYVGALEIPLKDADAQQLFLYYDGNLVRVSDGVYCFKEQRDLQKLNILFVSPTLIRYANDENTICHLTLTDDASYDLYQLKRMASLWECSKTSSGWSIKDKTIQKKVISGHERFVVPEHTLIIPLVSSFFEKNHDRVAFTYQAGSDTKTIIRLPSPKVAKNLDVQQLKEALVQAHVCIMNLKSGHAEPDKQCVRMDNHTMIQ